MSDLSPECAPKRTSADHSEFRAAYIIGPRAASISILAGGDGSAQWWTVGCIGDRGAPRMRAFPRR
jgi:hypothetical protein